MDPEKKELTQADFNMAVTEIVVDTLTSLSGSVKFMAELAVKVIKISGSELSETERKTMREDLTELQVSLTSAVGQLRGLADMTARLAIKDLDARESEDGKH